MPRSPHAVALAAFEVAVLPSPLGPVCAAASPDGIIGVEIRADPDAFTVAVARRTGRPAVRGQPADPSGPARRHLERFAVELAAFLAGRGRAFSGPLVFEGLSAWDRRVLQGVREIPFGATASYGEVARRVGAAGAARAAGGAVGRNPLALIVPCHRVIAGDGTLGGYGGAWPIDRDAALDLKECLLEIEGVRVPRRKK